MTRIDFILYYICRIFKANKKTSRASFHYARQAMLSFEHFKIIKLARHNVVKPGGFLFYNLFILGNRYLTESNGR